jgi:hypothetical protein
MIYELVIEDDKAKSVIAFLRQLDFVKVTRKPESRSVKTLEKKKEAQQDGLSYFGMCPDWDIDARELRMRGVKKRLKGWL